MMPGLILLQSNHARTSYLTSLLVGEEIKVQAWPVQDAKARFSEMLETCLREGPQIVTKRGAEAAVLMPMTEWRRLQRAARPTLKELLLTNDARGELNIPARGGRRRRQIGRLD